MNSKTSSRKDFKSRNQRFFESAIQFITKKVQKIEQDLDRYVSKNKNPFLQLIHRIAAPGAMRRERKELQKNVSELKAMLSHVTESMERHANDLESTAAPIATDRGPKIERPEKPDSSQNDSERFKMRNLLFLGAPFGVEIHPGMTAESFLGSCGNNTGNLMITQSLAQELRYEKASFHRLHGNLLVDAADADMIVFPASNFLNPSSDFTSVVRFLERVQLPCLMVGLGAQSKGNAKGFQELPAMTQRFISIVSERSDTIGVRGEYTAELLGRLGIKNVEIIGCPSFYAQCESAFPVSDTTVTPLKKVAIHGSRPVARQAFNADRMRAVEDALLKDALDYESAFFAQNGLEETQLALDSNSLADWQLESLTDYYRSSPPDKVRKFFRESNHIFGDLEAWKNTLSEYDFVVGTRFHGNIVALHAGVRSFLLVHDRRTEELAELLRLPHRRIDDPIFDSRCEIRRLYEEADFAPARKAFAELYPRYKNLLNRSGVTHYLQ